MISLVQTPAQMKGNENWVKKEKNEQSLVKGLVLIEVIYAKANQRENG